MSTTSSRDARDVPILGEPARSAERAVPGQEGKGEIVLVHLYPREMSIYGDLGNTRCLAARIRRHGGTPHQRPVVELGMCVGHVHQVAQFTLADRSVFNYQVLVGRNFLKGHIVVDSGSRFETKPKCTPSKGDEG